MLANVNVFDGEQLLGQRGVLVLTGVIERDLEGDDGVTRIHGTGRTLLRGLIDSHAQQRTQSSGARAPVLRADAFESHRARLRRSDATSSGSPCARFEPGRVYAPAPLPRDVARVGHRHASATFPCYNEAVTHAELLSRVSVDPNVCFGRPCIRGHRVWVSRVLDHLASGWPIAKVVANYPGIEEADVLACIAYGADMTRLRDLPPTAAAE